MILQLISNRSEKIQQPAKQGSPVTIGIHSTYPLLGNNWTSWEVLEEKITEVKININFILQ